MFRRICSAEWETMPGCRCIDVLVHWQSLLAALDASWFWLWFGFRFVSACCLLLGASAGCIMSSGQVWIHSFQAVHQLTRTFVRRPTLQFVYVSSQCSPLLLEDFLIASIQCATLFQVHAGHVWRWTRLYQGNLSINLPCNSSFTFLHQPSFGCFSHYKGITNISGQYTDCLKRTCFHPSLCCIPSTDLSVIFLESFSWFSKFQLSLSFRWAHFCTQMGLHWKSVS